MKVTHTKMKNDITPIKLEELSLGQAITHYQEAFKRRNNIHTGKQIEVQYVSETPAHTRTLGQILDAGEQSFPNHDPYYGQDL